MYLHIGQNKLIKEDSIIGFFDMDTSTVSKMTREYLYKAEKDGKVKQISNDLPKSFVVCNDSDADVIYISTLLSLTLAKRSINSLSNKEDTKIKETRGEFYEEKSTEVSVL